MEKEKNECPLCRLARGLDRVTKVYYENDVVIACDCKTHYRVPMIVLKRHTRFPTSEERSMLNKVANRRFPEKQFRGPSGTQEHFYLHAI